MVKNKVRLVLDALELIRASGATTIDVIALDPAGGFASGAKSFFLKREPRKTTRRGPVAKRRR